MVRRKGVHNGSRRGGVMKYKTRVRLGISEPLAGECIRDARAALLSASNRPYGRLQAAFCLLDGTLMQHSIRKREGTYVDDEISDDEDDEDDNDNNELNSTIDVDNSNENDDGGDDDNENDANDNPIGHQSWEESISPNLQSVHEKGTEENNDILMPRVLQGVRQLDGVENVDKRILNAVAEKVKCLAHALQSRDDSAIRKIVSDGARHTALYRAYATKWSWRVSNGTFDPATSTPDAASATRSTASSELRGKTRNHSRTTSMSMSSSSSSSPSSPAPLPSEAINSSHGSQPASANRLTSWFSQFNDDDRLSLLRAQALSQSECRAPETRAVETTPTHLPSPAIANSPNFNDDDNYNIRLKRRRSPFSHSDPTKPVTALLAETAAWDGWERVNVRQVEQLRNMLSTSDESQASDWIRKYGTAWRTIHNVSPPSFTFLPYCPDDQPILARALAHTFPDGLAQASRAPFSMFASLGGTVFRLSADERMQAFQCVVSNRGEDDVTASDRDRLEATWGLFKHACVIVTRAQDCLVIVAKLIDDVDNNIYNNQNLTRENANVNPNTQNVGMCPSHSQEELTRSRRNSKQGRFVLSRLASESVQTICRRCPLIDAEEAKALRQFACGYV